ncbi:PREDICTED: olfactory receptor-like protein COR4 [Nanorana parkeri]|uniref:olfactory receptor-like protein COR4 n=1 Tax=Nanorana parkeri TaxID=125878 RepID=UPI00085450E5|nr:PREDICTED: olfactory receptor-like protein COR4 [Nanorana parkeri]
MENRTILSELLLSGVTDLPYLQLPLFLLFLHIYCMTLLGNLLIILLVAIDSHLQTPMYFFLGNLAFLDLCSSSVTTPRMLFDLYTNSWKISVPACLTQVFFFILLVTTEIVLLAVMSLDRYVAICRPLHYVQIMQWKTCVQLAAGVWTLCIVYSMVHILVTLRLTFCDSNAVQSFFCDLSKLFQISCTDVFINILTTLLLGGLFELVFVLMTFIPYITVFSTVLKIKEKDKRLKAFSTCSSHLTVAFIFYGTLTFNYFKPSKRYQYTMDRVASVFYTMITPLLNPLIYSLRNQELKAAMKRVYRARRFSNM